MDYVCPKLLPPPKEPTLWRNTEALDNFAAYAILKFLWFNADKGQMKYKYTGVYYKGRKYENYEQVFHKLVSIKIDKYADEIMGFKRHSGQASSSELASEEL